MSATDAEGREQEIVDDLVDAEFDPVAEATFSQFWPLYQRVRTTLPPYQESREQIEGWYESLVSASSVMRANAAVGFLNFLRLSLTGVDVQAHLLSADPNLFGEDLASLHSSLGSTPSLVLIAPDSGKRALVTTTSDPETSALVGRVVRSSGGKLRAVVVWDGQGKMPKAAANVSRIRLASLDSNASAGVLKRLRTWFERDSTS